MLEPKIEYIEITPEDNIEEMRKDRGDTHHKSRSAIRDAEDKV